jgi:hypothetical protein
LLIEALIMDKPTMAVAFGDDKHEYNPGVSAQMTHFKELRNSGILEWCDDEARFEKSCRRIVGRCGTRNDPSLLKETLDRIVTRGPGTYAQRLHEYASEMVEPQARKRRHKRSLKRRDRQSHIYHAHKVVSEYCGLAEPRDIPGHWIHGWIPAHHNVHPFIFGTHKKVGDGDERDFAAQVAEEKDTVQHWVGRKDQELYLRSQGYRHVKAIGLPFAYLPPMDEGRIAGSLLVMPPHSHRNHGKGDALAEAYADAIADKRKAFSEIWCCLNVDDYQRGEWIDAFRKRNIPVFVGAEIGDPASLYRLKRLMSTFEYVTTNGFGSQIAYAAAAGAKLSIYGPFADCPRAQMAKSFVATIEPSLVDALVEFQTEAVLRRHYPFLFVDPENAVVQEEWGRKEIGADIRLDPNEIMRLFGWHDSTPQRPLLEDSRATVAA